MLCSDFEDFVRQIADLNEGVTQTQKTDSRPLECKPTVSLKDLSEALPEPVEGTQ
ncbi:MAG: hypothetical protein MJZ87_11995 [Bacteroidales bacterium]|nr:hypothetical protein [Bacteroidales bacterium]